MKNIDKYSELAGKFLTGETTPDEQQQLSEWAKANVENQQFIDDLEGIWKQTEGAKVSPFEADLDAAWAKVESGISSGGGEAESSGKIVPLSKRFRRWSVAAAILLAVGFGLWWASQGPAQPKFVEVRTGVDQRQEIVLPDGSQVWLNENSLLVYDEKFEQRYVELEGEAFFDVERLEENPFRIASGEATTTVLGTSFNVRAYPEEEEIEVTVKTGKVQLAVAKKEAAPVILPAGTSGVVNKKEEKVVKVERVEAEIVNADAWRTMKLEFDDTSIDDVIVTLERYFKTDIEVSTELNLDCPYSDEFTQPNLDDILQIIGGTLDFKATKTADGYLLTGPGCPPEN